jgi:predicted ATPase/DNA-binding SARP family transcriptional activator
VNRLRISLLGGFTVLHKEQPITAFESDQVRALLAYLALYPGQAHSRAAVAELLWPGRPEATARANLRHALSRLRHTLADAEAKRPLLWADHRTVRFEAADDVVCDAASFVALAEACAAHAHPSLDRCELCAPRLREAALLYRGSLLDGAPLSPSPFFESWLLARRAELDRHALTILGALASRAEAATDYQQLRELAARQLAIEPWYEPAHRHLMRSLALAGDRSGALAQYERCRAMLASELGIAPEPETHALYERIRAAALVPAARNDVARQQLPLPLTPFVGREDELAALRGYRDSRLLTLVGAGGMGKTRLALELARADQADQPDGVFFVALAPLGAVDDIAPTIAATLDLTLSGDQATALLRFLSDKRLLLILDNFEHLLAGAALVSAILEAAPRVQIIATSREPLSVRGEQIYLVEGLGYGAGDDPARAGITPAARLFVQSARRVQPAFALNDAAMTAVLRICRLVQGMPLGLELAATWMDRLPVEEVAAAIERHAGFLRADWRDAPSRQRSIQALFDWSWRLLSAGEQRALCCLSVFRGGWERAAAEDVAEVSFELLSRLVRKSLVRLGSKGRYEMHELVRQLAAERLDARAAKQTHARHSAYYLAFVAARERRLTAEEPRAAAAEIRTELDNVRQAWTWALAHARFDDFERSANGLYQFYAVMGQLTERQHMFALACRALQSDVDSLRAGQRARRTLGMLLALYATALARNYHPEQAIEAAQDAIAFARWSPEGEALAYAAWGWALHNQGQHLEARRRVEQALWLTSACRNDQSSSELISVLSWAAQIWLARIDISLGEYERARTHALQALQSCQAQQRRLGEVDCLLSLGDVARLTNDLLMARERYEHALQLAHIMGSRTTEARILLGLGDMLLLQSEYERAYELIERALLIARDTGETAQISAAVAALARLRHAMNDAAAAATMSAPLVTTHTISPSVAGWRLADAECPS